MDKLWCIYIMNITQQYQKHESLIQTTKWMNLKDPMFREKGQTSEYTKYFHIIMLT